MMISKHIPDELLDLARMIDWKQISDRQLHVFADQIRELAGKHGIPNRRPTANEPTKKAYIDNCPPKVFDFFASFDFSHVNVVLRKTAFEFIKKKLPTLVPCIKS